MTGTVREVVGRRGRRRRRGRAGRQPDHPQRRGGARDRARTQASLLESGVRCITLTAPGADPPQGRRGLRGGRPARRVEGARRAATRSPGVRRPSAPSSPSSRTRACSRTRTPRPAACRPTRATATSSTTCSARGTKPQPRSREALARAPRGRRGDARHHRDALAGHEPARARLGAADRDDHDPPRRGAGAPAAGPDGRDHHLDRRRLQARVHVRASRSTPASPTGPRATSTSGSSAPDWARGCCSSRLADPSLPATERGFLERARARLHATSRTPRATRSTSTAPRGCCPSTASQDLSQLNDLMEVLERRVALPRRAALGARPSASVYVRIGHENEIPALRSLAIVAANYGLPQRNLGTVSVIGPVRMDYASAIGSVREAAGAAVALRRGRLRRVNRAMPRDYYEVLGVSRDAERDRRSRRPSGGSRASCIPTSTRTTRRPRRSSRRPPRPTRSSPTPSAAPSTTATATRACARGGYAPNFEGFGSFADIFDAFFGGGDPFGVGGAAAARCTGGDVGVAVDDRRSRRRRSGAAGERRVRGRRAAASTATATAPSPARRSRPATRCGGTGQLQTVTRTRVRPARAHGRLRRAAAATASVAAGSRARCAAAAGAGAHAQTLDGRRARPGIADGQRIRAQRPRPRGRARRAARRPLRARARARGRALRARRRRPRDASSTSRRRWPRSARRVEVADARRRPSEVEIAAGHAAGRDRYALRGRGMPRAARRGRRGDLRVVVNVVIPRHLTRRAARAARAAARARSTEENLATDASEGAVRQAASARFARS